MMNNKILVTFFIIMSTMISKGQEVLKSKIKLIKKENFETVVDSKKVTLYTLKNSMGTYSQITNFGGKVVSLWLPDSKGNYEDVVLGYGNIDDYLTAKEKYFGALIGRYGNRIGQGKFTLEGKEYILAINNGANHLHGGNKGYDAVVWDAKQLNEQSLELRELILLGRAILIDCMSIMLKS